jgi:acetyl-CoA acetyltransferase
MGAGARTTDVVESHDCFTSNGLLSYEALGLCPSAWAVPRPSRGTKLRAQVRSNGPLEEKRVALVA